MSTAIHDPRATVVILAWNAWEQTRACLESLESTLGPRDQVIVVDNGSSDATSEALRQYNWIEVVTNETNQGFATGSNQGAALARGESIVFLNNDTVLCEGWLDELLAPLTDSKVAAVGPRSNNVSGVQNIPDVQYRLPGYAGIAEYATQWHRLNTSRTSESMGLVRFCMAVRAEVFRSVDGFDERFCSGGYEVDDLCMKIRGAGHLLMVAHGSYVHHTGHASFDANEINGAQRQSENKKLFDEKWQHSSAAAKFLLSVCLIVKDEEELLGACLESVVDVADEMVVYDTGSTDRTIEIARAAGAKVIEGYWDDNFARARNAALEHASGEWVLSIDADEILLSDPHSLRNLLSEHSAEVEAFIVAIENLEGTGNTRTIHTATRMFRRTSANWVNRLHEQVAARNDASRGLRTGYLSAARIIHRGYVDEIFNSRHKAERNLALAKASLDDEGISKPYALMNYGRALASAGKHEEAIETLRESILIADGATSHRLGLMNLIYLLGSVERFDEALEMITELRRVSVSPIAADIAEGRVRIAIGENETGLALLARVPPRGRDDDGMEYAAHTLAAIRGEALASLGRFGEGADIVLDTIRTDGFFESDIGELVKWLANDDRSPSEIARVLDVHDLLPVLARVLRQPPTTADQVLEGIFERFPDRLEPLAAAGRIAHRLDVARALVWSSRLRARGFANACPLVTIAKDEDVDPRVRILAAAAAFGSFGERAVVNAVHDARSQLDAQGLEEANAQITRLAPGLLEAEHLEQVVPVVAPVLVQANLLEQGRPGRARLTLAPVRANPQRGGVNVVGAFESTSMRGEVARCIAGTLTRYGYSVSTTSYEPEGRKGSLQWQHRDAGDYPFDTTLMVMSPDDLTNFVMDNGAASFEGRYVIGVWQPEIDCARRILGLCAQMVQEIWVPSQFTAEMVRGLTDRRVAHMAIPVSTVRPPSHSISKSTEVVFLASVDYAAGFQRQNPLAVVAAFRSAFEHTQGPRLVIEVAHASRYPFEHGALMKSVGGRSDITVAASDGATGRILHDWRSEQSCLVSLHRSEGTGLALLRAMNLGVVSISTAHSCGAEFLGEHDSYQIPFTLSEIPEGGSETDEGLRWAEPDIDRAASAMRLVVEDPKLLRLKARKSRERAKQSLGASHAVRAMRQRLVAIDELRYGNAGGAPRRIDAAVSTSR